LEFKSSNEREKEMKNEEMDNTHRGSRDMCFGWKFGDTDMFGRSKQD
jgi:hypothetical protein